jgi:hypothetical protein
MNELRIASLHLHPIKSCAGWRVEQARLEATGLPNDRRWMVVQPDGNPATQRELPRMALIRPSLDHAMLTLSAPDAGALSLPIEAAGEPCRVRVWSDEVAALDLGHEAARWLSGVLGTPLRLVRFDDAQTPRLSQARWTGEHRAPNRFADAFPLLVVSSAGLAELNRRLVAQGEAPVGIERFRPNVVLDGLDDPNGEDWIDELRFETPQGPVVLKLVKPCVRCTIPSVDPATGEQGHAVGDALAAYRADSRMDGGITFGMNALVVEGVGRMLRVGMAGEASLAF